MPLLSCVPSFLSFSSLLPKNIQGGFLVFRHGAFFSIYLSCFLFRGGFRLSGWIRLVFNGSISLVAFFFELFCPSFFRFLSPEFTVVLDTFPVMTLYSAILLAFLSFPVGKWCVH